MRFIVAILLLLSGIIGVAQTTTMRVVDTANALQALNPNDINKVAFLRGYTNVLDADGATFYYDPASAAATNTTRFDNHFSSGAH